VVLNRERLYVRLRSKHAKQTFKVRGKPQIIPSLVEAVSRMVASRSQDGLLKDDFQRLKAKVNELRTCFGLCEGYVSSKTMSKVCLNTLCELVQYAHDLGSELDLAKMLAASNLLEPDSRTSLPIAIRKLGRYYSASNYLVHAARKFSYFKNIKIEILIPPPRSQLQTAWSPPTASDRLADILRSEPQMLHLDLAQTVTKTLSACRLPNPDRHFQMMLLAEQPVHAEIQLLFYYESNPNTPRPRVICSRKDACFLCDLFVRLHGGFQVRKTHGRIYEKWTLPETPRQSLSIDAVDRISSIATRMNTILERTIRATAIHGRLGRAHPNESTVTAFAILLSAATSSTALKGKERLAIQELETLRNEDRIGDIQNYVEEGSPTVPHDANNGTMKSNSSENSLVAGPQDSPTTVTFCATEHSLIEQNKVSFGSDDSLSNNLQKEKDNSAEQMRSPRPGQSQRTSEPTRYIPV